MDATRRFWGALGCAGILGAGAAAFDSLLLLVGTAVLLAWLFGAQLLFLRTLGTLDDAAQVTVESSSQFPIVDEPTTLTVQVTVPKHQAVGVAIDVPLPPAADGDAPGQRIEGATATMTTTVEWATAGTFAVGPARLTAVDPFGLFVQSMAVGSAVEVHPTPRHPETVHLGRGGDRVAAAFGAHTTDGTGPGIEPAELREYQPGDDVRQIDWKATARLGEPHVMDSTAETDRRTVLLVDQCSNMAIGPAGATLFEYARAGAIAVTESARGLGDPLGLYLVGDEGITAAHPPGSSPATYDQIETALRAATPTTATGDDGRFLEPTRSATGARRMAGHLDGRDDTFSATLAPLLGSAAPYLERVQERPLFRTARTHVGALQGTTWTVLITDDSDRGELTETVDLLRRGNDHVLVVLAPSALFEADGLADVDAAARSYSDFESFRRDLAAMDRVEALELAPGDRLATVLSTAEGSA